MKARDVFANGLVHSRALLAALAIFVLCLALGAGAGLAAAPSVTVEDAANVGYTTADVEGTVNPEGQPTNWRFQFATEADFSNAQDGPSGFTEASETVSGQLSGLQPDTTYHLRLLAENGDGTSEAVAVGTFTTLAVAQPAISNLAVSAVDFESAHFSAEVDPGGADPAFDTSWHFECTPVCPDLKGGTVSGAAAAVEADAIGLQPKTAYTVRLVASNAGGESEASEAFDTTAGAPAVDAFAAGPVSFDQASINAEINPRNSPTTYWFEWGSEDCSAPGASCQSVPAGQDGVVGEDNQLHYVTQHLSGLSPQTTYHFRVVAENEVATVEGPDLEFTTAPAPPATCPNEARRSEQQADYLPDCRAYEMVSPVDKEGGNVATMSSKTFAAADGDAAVFTSFTGFSEPEGMGTIAEYRSQRQPSSGATGWSTRPITPQLEALTIGQILVGQVPGFEASFTPDLNRGVYRTWTSLTDDPWTAETGNFYLQDNLRTGVQTSQLVTGCPLCAETKEPVPPTAHLRPIFAGASTDLSHVIFESPLALTPEASFGALNLYESVDGEVRLAGILPDGSPAPESMAGEGVLNSYPLHLISAAGDRVFFKVPSSGNIYMREEGTTTVQLNESEKAVPGEPQPATLVTASEDGSRAFFITSEGLVDGDDNALRDAYMYDVTKPVAQRLTRLSLGTGDVEAITGASEDGHYVYFISKGTLYLWRDGVVKSVGGLGLEVSLEEIWWNSPAMALYAFPINELQARVSPDGRHLLFVSRSDALLRGHGGFPGYDHGTECTFDTTARDRCRELYLYSADSGRLACVSCGAAGTTASSDALNTARVSVGAVAPTWHLSQSLSDDGRYVFFNTGQALVERDTNGEYDAYAYDTRTGEARLLSSGTDRQGSYFLDASDDGRDVFIVTAEQLLGWDNDRSYDLYDARVDGGFPEPAPTPAACEGESCRGAAAAAPPPLATGSGSVQEKGNAPIPRCPKGRRPVRRHGNYVCVKKKHRPQKKRGADHDRRANR